MQSQVYLLLSIIKHKGNPVYFTGIEYKYEYIRENETSKK